MREKQKKQINANYLKNKRRNNFNSISSNNTSITNTSGGEHINAYRRKRNSKTGHRIKR